jgi:hypothetical protein
VATYGPLVARCLPGDQAGRPVGQGPAIEDEQEDHGNFGAYDLTGSYRAAELAGCDHHTVAWYVRLRESGYSPVAREHLTVTSEAQHIELANP